jgi:hypothetical protein
MNTPDTVQVKSLGGLLNWYTNHDDHNEMVHRSAPPPAERKELRLCCERCRSVVVFEPDPAGTEPPPRSWA